MELLDYQEFLAPVDGKNLQEALPNLCEGPGVTGDAVSKQTNNVCQLRGLAIKKGSGSLF